MSQDWQQRAPSGKDSDIPGSSYRGLSNTGTTSQGKATRPHTRSGPIPITSDQRTLSAHADEDDDMSNDDDEEWGTPPDSPPEMGDGAEAARPSHHPLYAKGTYDNDDDDDDEEEDDDDDDEHLSLLQQQQRVQQHHQSKQKHSEGRHRGRKDEDDVSYPDHQTSHAQRGQPFRSQGPPLDERGKQHGQGKQPPRHSASSLHKDSPSALKGGSSPAGRGKPRVTKQPAASDTLRTQSDVADNKTRDRPRTIAVRGLDSSFQEDYLQMYFEHKRSTGGPVEDITPYWTEGVVYVTFTNPEDAERVCKKTDHKLGDKKLTVCLQQKPRLMNDRLLLRQLPEFFDTEDMQLFLKEQTKHEAHKIVFGEDETVALVIFDTDIGLTEVQTKLSGAQFQGHILTAELVPQTSAIIVHNYTPSGPDDEMIEMYFDNMKRSGGGGVTGVKHFSDDGYYLVTFEDPEAVARVVSRSHRISNQCLDVSPYHRCLGESGGHDQRSLQFPAPVQLGAETEQKLSLVLQIPGMEDNVARLLEELHGQLDQQGEKVQICCTVTKDTPDCRSLLQDWKENTEKATAAHFDSFTVTEESITKEEFEEAKPRLEELADRSRGETGFVFHDGQQKISIVFHTLRQGSCAEEMQCAIRDTRRKLHRAANAREKTVDMTQQEMRLIQGSDVERSVTEKYPELQVTYDDKSEAVTMNGLPEEMAELEEAFSALRDTISHLTYKFDSPQIAQLLSSSEARAILQEACLKEDLKGVVEFEPSAFSVWSLDTKRATRMKKAGRDAIQRAEVTKSPEMKDVWESEEFNELLRSVQERRQGSLVFHRPDQSSLVVLAVGSTLQQDVQEIQDFLTEESARQLERFDMDPQNYALFTTFLHSQDGQVRDFALHYDEASSKLEATTNKTGLAELTALLETFQESLISETRVFTEPSFMKYIESRAGQGKVREIREGNACLLGEFVDEGRGDSTLSEDTCNQQQQVQGNQAPQTKERAFVDSEAEDPDHVENDGTTMTAPKYPRIFLTDMNDITKVEHHFFVNSTNPELQLSLGQVSTAFINIGGPGIQEECKKNYPNGIQYGEIAITGPGRTKRDFEQDGEPFLDCKHILHCCLPFTKETEEMERVVREAVNKSLALADTLCPQYQRKSIGMPALGAGNLAYPPELVAQTMYLTVMDYGNEHQDTSIEDVYFVLHKKDETLTKVFVAEHAKYCKAQKARIGGGEQEDQCYFSKQQPTAKGMENHHFFQKTRSRVAVEVTALSQADIENTVQELLRGYREDIVEANPEVERLNYWDPSHIEQVITSCRAAQVDLTLNFDLNRLTIRGHRDNVSVSLLHNIIKDAEEEINERENAHLVAWQVQWNWLEVTALETMLKPYDRLNNYRIEKAYREGKNTAIVYDRNRTAFQIDFEKMKEKPELTGGASTTQEEEEEDAVEIMRQDKIRELSLDAPPPETWSDMMGHLDVVRLDPSSSEYKKVAEDFMRTSITNLSRVSGTDPYDLMDIVKIERVQNLTLYKQYMAIRKQMAGKFQQNVMFERRPLWHGTKGEVSDSIIKYGFNRSFCERSKYGEAVYFAKTSSYSMGGAYAKRNEQEERVMFYCRVLVGDFIQGQEGMRFLPTRQRGADKDYDSAVDDVQDPKIFVVYKDAQAYPEYKIVFKEK